MLFDTLPAGIMRMTVDYILSQNYRPNGRMSLLGAPGLMSVVVGRTVGIDRTHTNLYLLGLSPTGNGKDAPKQCLKDNLAQADCRMRWGSKPTSVGGLFSDIKKSPAKILLWDEFSTFLAQPVIDAQGKLTELKENLIALQEQSSFASSAAHELQAQGAKFALQVVRGAA